MLRKCISKNILQVTVVILLVMLSCSPENDDGEITTTESREEGCDEESAFVPGVFPSEAAFFRQDRNCFRLQYSFDGKRIAYFRISMNDPEILDRPE